MALPLFNSVAENFFRENFSVLLDKGLHDERHKHLLAIFVWWLFDNLFFFLNVVILTPKEVLERRGVHAEGLGDTRGPTRQGESPVVVGG